LLLLLALFRQLEGRFLLKIGLGDRLQKTAALLVEFTDFNSKLQHFRLEFVVVADQRCLALAQLVHGAFELKQLTAERIHKGAMLRSL